MAFDQDVFLENFSVQSFESETIATNIKFMIPNSISGAIIGKNGDTVGKLQDRTSTEITISKGNSYFPYTKERVVFVSGTIKGILEVLIFVNGQIKAYDDPKDDFDEHHATRNLEFKLIIPDSSAGALIGKKGEFARSIEESTGISMTMSSKELAHELKLSERVVTLSAQTFEKLLAGTEMVLKKVATDPNVNLPYYANVVYDTAAGAGADRRHRSRSPVDRSFGSGMGNRSALESSFARPTPPGGPGFGFGGGSSFDSSQGSRPFSAGSQFGAGGARGGGLSNFELLQLLDNVRGLVRTRGLGPTSEAEIMQAVQTLAKYDVLGLALNLSSTSSQGQPVGPRSDLNGSFQSTRSVLSDYDPSFPTGASGMTMVTYGGLQSLAGRFPHASAAVTEKRVEEGFYEMLVPDGGVGAIVGKGGRTIMDIQGATGTLIDVEKRHREEGGGKKDRLVSVEGEPEGVYRAFMALMQCIEDELRRGRRR